MHRLVRPLGLSAILAFTLLFISIWLGPLPNNDDLLYAGVIRSVLDGHIWPLHFGPNIFFAKPPLFFWLGAASVAALGDHEAAYRLVSFISLGLILLLALRRFRDDRFTAYMLVLLCLGSTLTMDLSRRVLIELPLAAAGLWALYFAQSVLRGGSAWPLALTCAVGFGLKEIAFAPFLAAIASALLVTPQGRLALKAPQTLLALSLGLILPVTLLMWQQPAISVVSSIARVADASPTGLSSPWSTYWNTLWEDHPLIWAAPVLVAYSFLRRDTFARLLAAAWCFSALALSAVDLKYAHYMQPFILLSLWLWGSFISSCSKNWIRAALVLITIIQVVRVQVQLWEPHSFHMYWGQSTHVLSGVLNDVLPPKTSVCAINAYPVGFAFYTRRPMLGLYTSDRAYATVNAVSEFKGMIFRINTPEVMDFSTRCGGAFVGPTAYFKRYPQYFEVVSEVNLLAVARLFSSKEQRQGPQDGKSSSPP